MEYFELKNGMPFSEAVETPDWDMEGDIIVAGGGSAGVYCALAAAREGKSVMVIEKSPWCGGAHVNGLVNGYYYGCRGGLYEETDQSSRQLVNDAFYELSDAKRLVIARRLIDNNVDAWCSSAILGVYATDKRVEGVRAALDEEILDIRCQVLVDATGDGHVIRMLPIKTSLGRATDNGLQPFSCLRSVYRDTVRYDGGLSVSAARVSDRFGVFHEYRDNGHVNQYDECEYSDAIIGAHASHLRTLEPNNRFLYVASQIGVREGVLFEGEQTVTLDSVLGISEPPENILLYGFSDIDKHGSDLAFDDDTYQDWFHNCNMSTCVVYLPFPVGSLVPKGWKGLLSAGRLQSVDSYVNSAMRMNTDIMRLGEAAGALAAMATDCDGDAMAVPYERIRGRLEELDFYAKDLDMRPSFWWPGNNEPRRFFTWMTEADEIEQCLATDRPGVALWSCRLLGKERIGDSVYAMAKSNDEMLRYNAGVALGVMQDDRALPILREIVKERRAFYYLGCRRSNQLRSAIAICLLGRMGDAEAIDELINILKPEEFDKPMYHKYLEPNYTYSIVDEQNAVYHHHFTNAVVALVKIALKHPERADKIKAALGKYLDDEAYIRRITSAPEWNVYYQVAAKCKKYYIEKLVS